MTMNYTATSLGKFFEEALRISTLKPEELELAKTCAVSIVQEENGSARGEALCAGLAKESLLIRWVEQIREHFVSQYTVAAIRLYIKDLAAKPADRTEKRLAYIERFASWTPNCRIDLEYLMSEASSFMEGGLPY
jgi:hypothetical protein